MTEFSESMGRRTHMPVPGKAPVLERTTMPWAREM